jgi:RNA polymerase sigma-70 factor, ECF subfamily
MERFDGRANVHLEQTSFLHPPDAGLMPSEDARLLAQIQRGDAEAGRRLVREQYPGVYRYLLYLTGQAEAAKDLTQETFVQAWRNLDTLDETVRLRPWLHCIARRVFLQALRSRRPQLPLDSLTDLSEPRAAAFTDAVELRALIQALPLEEREMVVLHYLEGYNSDEVARIMGVPAGTVRYRLSEARARLRHAFGDTGPGEGRRDKE